MTEVFQGGGGWRGSRLANRIRLRRHATHIYASPAPDVELARIDPAATEVLYPVFNYYYTETSPFSPAKACVGNPESSCCKRFLAGGGGAKKVGWRQSGPPSARFSSSGVSLRAKSITSSPLPCSCQLTNLTLKRTRPIVRPVRLAPQPTSGLAPFCWNEPSIGETSDSALGSEKSLNK